MTAPIFVIPARVSDLPPCNKPPSDWSIGQELYRRGCPVEWCNDKNAGEWLGWVAARNDATPQERTQHADAAEEYAAEQDWRYEAESNYLGGLL